jgi:quercetin 2,3-dioxygenase
MDMNPVLAIEPLETPWKTPDPFLFSVHHDDAYPRANGRLGPAASLAGRDLGQDFAGKDGWRMYHGRTIPGFPQHPHRGFETVTVVNRGFIDHADSLGASARYGNGDVQWLTAGQGVLHSEMFPLLREDAENPLELFQIWLNLPRRSKLVKPYFTMFWNDRIPVVRGDGVEVRVIAGGLGDARPLAPPPDSWASADGSDVAIWTLKLAPGARWTLPPARKGVNRTLYFYRGDVLRIGAEDVPPARAIRLQGDAEVPLENTGSATAELLLLQGQPIGEPVVQYGPFVMNTRQEIADTFADYQRTQFGGWPWESDDPVLGPDPQRFARHADGQIEKPAR